MKILQEPGLKPREKWTLPHGDSLRWAAGVLILTALSLFVFPGRTILQSDTQIYVPILERLHDPALLSNDVMAARPHVAFTVYDEAALALRRLTGANFETILQAQQALYRALGIVGLLLLASALGFGPAECFAIVAVASLGSTAIGPAVLTVEYEPVPRGFAMPMLLLAMGLLGHGRWMAAAAVCVPAFWFHPPTALPVMLLLGVALLRRREWRAATILGAGAVAMCVFVWLQSGNSEHSPLFERLSPELESLQRMRASYSYVSVWLGRLWKHWLILASLCALALWRLRIGQPDLKIFLVGLPLIGVCSIPLSYGLLEGLKWTLMPQLQPGRYLVFVSLFAMFLGSCAAVRAANERRTLEAFAFFAAVLSAAFPSTIDRVWTSMTAPRAFAILAGALLLAAAVRSARGYALAAAALIPFWLLPYIGKAVNFPDVHRSELNELAAWARGATPSGAVFFFPGAGQQPQPAIFRARSARALYVDWKGGGQVNFLPEFAKVWWSRWQETEKERDPGRLAALGIDYLVYPNKDRLPDRQPVHENDRYVVYKVR